MVRVAEHRGPPLRRWRAGWSGASSVPEQIARTDGRPPTQADTTPTLLEAVPLDQIADVQFSDAPAPTGDSLARETMHRRALPGDGNLALERFATTLLQRGWDGLVSVEVLSAQLRALPVDEALRRLHATTAPYWL
jgi:hypothetical protein